MGQRTAAAVAGVLLAGSLAATAAAAGDRCYVRSVDYNGWKCVLLTSGRIDVVIAPQLGGRIIQLRLGEAEYLWVNPKLAGKVVCYADGSTPVKGKPEWVNYGGDKLWPAPQGTAGPDQWPGPPDPFRKGGTVDNGKYKLEVLDSGPEEASVRLTSPKDRYAGICFIRDIRIRPRTTTVELKSTMVNVADRVVRWGIWQVTQHGGHIGKKGAPIRYDAGQVDVQAWSPLNSTSRYPKGYYVMFGPEDNPQFSVDTTLADKTGVRLFRLDYGYQVGKVGMDNASGWLAVTHRRSGYLYAHTFPALANQEHPDGASVEFWASGPGKIQMGDKTIQMSANEPVLIESEVLTPFAKLQPKQRFSYESKIHLGRGAGPFVKVSAACAEVERVRGDAKHGVAGRLAVFEDGKLQVHGRSLKEATVLGEVRAGELVDVGELASRVKVRQVRRLRFVNVTGKPLDEWRIRAR